MQSNPQIRRASDSGGFENLPQIRKSDALVIRRNPPKGGMSTYPVFGSVSLTSRDGEGGLAPAAPSPVPRVANGPRAGGVSCSGGVSC